jgi:hypothetical protein
MTKKKGLPRGNLKAVGNLKPGKRGVMGPTQRRALAFGARGEALTVLPIHYGTKPPHPYNVRPGFEEAALPEQGVPGSEWWNQPPYNGRRR